MKKLTLFALLIAVTITIALSMTGMALATAQVSTYDPATGAPKLDFAPEETVLIKGSGFPAITAIDVKVTRPDGSVVTGDGSFTLGYDTVLTYDNGDLNYSYILDGIQGSYLIECFESGTSNLLASGTFTDNRYKLYGKNKNGSWETGNFGGYTEGDSVDFKLKISVSSKDVKDGPNSTPLVLWHKYLQDGATGFESASGFSVGDVNGNPVSGASWSGGTGGPNGNNIEYGGTFTATSEGVYYLYWKGHLSNGSSAWPDPIIHSGVVTPTGNHTVPMYKPSQGQPGPDIEDPTGSVTINNGALYTKNAAVTLSLSASDNVGVTSMMISNNSAFIGAAWELYATSKAWPLDGPDGLNTVYVKYKDAANNESDPAALDTITLDTTIPSITDETGDVVVPIGEDATITATVTDATSGVAEVNLVYRRTGSYGDRTVAMTRVGSTDIYQGTIPAADIGNDPDVEYNINAYDNADNSNSVGVYYASEGVAPHIDSLTPDRGPIGTTVTIDGSGFGSAQGSSAVSFNGTDAGLSITWSDTQITISVPAGATTGNVVVTVDGNASNGVLFTVIPAAPTGLAAIPGDTIVNLNWDAVTGATGYKVYYGTTSGSYGLPVDVNNTTSTTIYGLTNGVTYYFVVTAYDAANESGYSVEKSATPSAGITLAYDYGRYEESSGAVTQSGTGWGVYRDPQCSGSTERYTKIAGDTVSFTFTGNSIKVLATKAWNRGIANVYIDGVPQGQADFYTPGPNLSFQQQVFNWTGTSGTHTIRVEATNNRNVGSNDNYIGIDAFEVTNGATTYRYEDHNGILSYVGNWGVWDNVNLSGAGEFYSKVVGDSQTFFFTGSTAIFVTAKAWNRGIANIYVDGELEGTADLYAPTIMFKQEIYRWTGPFGMHTLRVEVSGNKNNSATDTYIGLDYFEIPMTLIEDTSSSIAYLGAWNTWLDGSVSGGSEKYSKQIGARVSFSFTGTAVTWQTCKCWNRGIARVYIDNVAQADVDLYDVNLLRRQEVFSKGHLDYGTHTVVVEALGSMNSLANDTYIGVDCFRVW